jgi:MFS family permease
MRAIHLPVWLGSVKRPRAKTFAALFALSIVSRALLITVIPLNANALLGSAQRVSLLYFGVSIVALLGSFSIPWLVHKIRRRRVFTLGCLATVAAMPLLASDTLTVFVLGMMFLVFAISCLEITFNLYLMDHIPREELGRFEPLRVFFAAGSWTLGPWLGVYLQKNVADWAPFACAAIGALVLCATFWILRLKENPAVAPAKGPPPRPTKYLHRFFGQPRLRLAWFLAMGRSAWWSMFFVFAPIYAVDSGLSPETGGAIVSLGAAAVFGAPLWGWVGRRFGFRRLLIGGYGLSALATYAIAVFAGIPDAGAMALVAAAVVTGIIDGAGNLPFLRAVHPWERPEMTTVFSTYRDMALLAPPGIFAVLLKVFALPAVFVASASFMVVLAVLSRYLPRRF